MDQNKKNRLKGHGPRGYTSLAERADIDNGLLSKYLNNKIPCPVSKAVSLSYVANVMSVECGLPGDFTPSDFNPETIGKTFEPNNSFWITSTTFKCSGAFTAAELMKIHNHSLGLCKALYEVVNESQYYIWGDLRISIPTSPHGW